MATKSDNKEHSIGQDHFDDLIARNIPAGEKEVMEREATRGAAQDIAEREGLAGASSSQNDRGAASRRGLRGQETSASDTGDAGSTGSGDSGQSGLSKRWNKIKQHKKQAIFGGILGLGLLGGGFSLFTITSGPFQIIHGGQLLGSFHNGPIEEFGNDRSAKFMLYALAGQSAKGRLGFIKNHNADKWEKRLNDHGLKSVYTPTTGRLVGYQVIDAGKSAQFVADMERNGNTRSGASPNMGIGIDGIPIAAGDGDVIVTKRGDYKAARSVTRSATKSIGTNKVAAWMGYRLQTKRGGIDFHPLKYAARRGADRVGFEKDVRDARKKALEDGVNTGGPSSRDRNNRRSIQDRFKQLMRIARGPVILVAAACGFKAFSDSIDAQNLDNQLQMMRLAGEKLTLASQVMSNKDFSLDQLRVYVDDYYDEDAKTSWTQDNGIKHEAGEEMDGYDLIEESKPSRDPKPWYFQVVDNPLISVPLIPVCWLVETAGEAINSVPGVEQAGNIIQSVIDGVLVLLTDKTAEQWIQVARDYFATEGIDVLAEGAKRGGYDNVGMALLAKNQFEAMGGTGLTAEEGNAVKSAALDEQKQEFAQASIFDRYFNPNESRSALATMAFAAPRNRTQFIASIQRLPVNFGNTAMRMLGMHRAFAATATTYDYGFDMSGFTLAEQQDEAYEDPIANENYILEGDRLERMNTDYGTPCFFMTITRNGDLQYGETGNMLTTPDKCRDKNNKELTRYRFYKADLTIGHTMACLEGDESSCSQIGMGAAGAGTPTTGAPGTVGPIDMATIFQPSDTMTCPVGTDGGVQDGYKEGAVVKIRICNVESGVPGKTVEVNARIATNVDALYKAAAAAGSPMSGGGFRTMAEQQNTYNNNCGPRGCSPPTAKPGYSNHQMGLAIDFTQDGTVINFGDTGYNWLKANAANYGLQNLPSETWHWSVDGG